MKLIAGLGNPGTQYLSTRHNIGFMAIEALGDRWTSGRPPWKSGFSSVWLKTTFAGEEILLQKPQTYMNLSGTAVRELLTFFKINLSDLLVVHDEVDIPFAKLKFAANRGPGGHNGIKSIHSELGSSAYARLRLGVGRPPHPEMATADFVLQNFSPDEKQALQPWLGTISEAIECWIKDGLQKASTRFNA